MAFALTAALRRGAIEFLHALVERVDLNSGQKITACAVGPGAFVQPTKNKMRPRLILGLGGREKLDAGVGMLAEQIARDAHADRKLIEPLQKKRPRKDRVDLRRPRCPLRDLAPAFVPTEKCESVCANLEKFGERSFVWQEDNICQRSGNPLAVAIALACRCDQEREIVDGNIGQGSLQRATDLVAGRVLEK